MARRPPDPIRKSFIAGLIAWIQPVRAARSLCLERPIESIAARRLCLQSHPIAAFQF